MRQALIHTPAVEADTEGCEPENIEKKQSCAGLIARAALSNAQFFVCTCVCVCAGVCVHVCACVCLSVSVSLSVCMSICGPPQSSSHPKHQA